MVTDWPKNSTIELRRTLFQAERIYSGGLSDPVVFGDRPLWRATFDWELQPTEKARKIQAQIASVAKVESVWNLFESGKHNRAPVPVTSTWGVQVSAYDKSSGEITFNGNVLSEAGDYLQVGRYVLQISAVSGRVVTVENFPEAIDKLSSSARNALTFGYDRDDLTNPLQIRAQVLDALPPPVERINSRVSRVFPITIVEVP